MDSSRRSNDPLKTSGTEACTQCRKVKMKCRSVLGRSTCERCIRLSMECIFHQKKRGRKPTRHRVTAQDIARPDESQSTSHAVISDSLDPVETPGTLSDPATSLVGQGSVLDQDDDADSDFWANSEGLQPSSLLNRQATKGKFSLQNILSTTHASYLDKTKTVTTPPEDDPISRGILSYHVASSLFEGFMKSLNPFICVLDPALHTFTYVRERSSFLLTVILAVAARSSNPQLHPDLHKHSEKLFVDSFARNAKSTEVIQAIVLNTYWKQPDDTRSWSTIGYCIRLCMELGWHKLAVESGEERSILSELERRQKRDVERTWFVLFVYDRSMSLQTGKPWMIERSDFIESANTWYKNPVATSNDACMAALVTLRLASADILEVFSPQRPAPSMSHPYRVEALLKTLSVQVEAWKKHWTFVTSDKETCHSFLVCFFGTHLSLLLYSFQLQGSISSSIGPSLVDTEAFWITYTSALEMLRLVSQPSLSPILSLAHDSIHAMTAYAASFLIKLLLSVNGAMRQEFEATIIEAIEVAALVFAQQSTPPNSSCTLQANFLTNVVHEYQKFGRPQVPGPTSDNIGLGNRMERQTGQSTELGRLQARKGRDTRSRHLRRVSQVQQAEVSTESASIGRAPALLDSSHETLGDTEDGSPMHNDFIEGPLCNEIFTDDQGWLALFLNAGFDIDGGVFVPN